MLRRGFFWCVLLVIIQSESLMAQSNQVFDEIQTPIPGAGHDYLGMANETVNPIDGSVSFRLGVPVPPGRKLNFPFAFAYDSAGVHVGVSSSRAAGWSCSGLPGGQIPLVSCGWTYQVPFISSSLLTKSAPESGETGLCQYFTDFTFHDASGGHVLGIDTFIPAYCRYDTDKKYGLGAPSYSASTTGGGRAASVTVVDADGTAFHFPNPYPGLPDYIEDRNGNKITLSGLTSGQGFNVTDTVGRVSPYALSVSGFGVSGNTVSLSGLSNPYTVTWGSASSNFGTTWTQTVSDNGGCLPATTDNETQSVITAIKLPNGQQYTLGYDPTYGELDQITYPNGGWVKYTWGLDPGSTLAQFYDSNGNRGCFYRHDTPAVLHRYVSFDGSTIALQQDFTYSPPTWAGTTLNWTKKVTTVKTTDFVHGGSFTTVYQYAPGVPYAGPGEIPHVGDLLLPAEETAITYNDWDTNGGATLRTVNKGWFDQYLVTSESTTLDNGLTSKVGYSYTSYGQLQEKDEYDYGQTSPSRETVINYQSFANTPIFTAGPSIFDRPSSVIICSGSGTCTGASTNRVAETDYKYDESLAIDPCNGCTIAGHDAANYAPATTAPRGNATTKTIKCFQIINSTTTTCPQDIVNKYTYYETGQVASATDATLTNVTQYSYTDTFDANPAINTNAYLTTLTYPPTGSVSHQEKFKYAYSDGQLITSTDQNGNQTSYLYNDSLRRPTEVDYPVTAGHTLGGQTIYSYVDTVSSNSPYIQRLDRIDDSGTQSVFYTQFDGFGRVMRTARANGVPGWEQADICYDGLGRKSFASYPYQGPGFTAGSHFCFNTQLAGDTFNYDALGRPTRITHSDGSFASTNYTGRAVQVSDEGNGSKSVQRASQTDGLGRLTSVCEITNITLFGTGSSPSSCGLDINTTGFLTSYAYDALGNLLSAAQGSTTRSFQYDSLSRLTQAQNPESGNTNYFYVQSGGGFCSGVSGDVCQKTDARGITTTFLYNDALNRLTGKTYSDSTPAVTINYDETTAQGVTLTNTIGRRSSASTGGTYPTGEIFSYDTVGRVTDNSQCTPQNCGTAVFPVPYKYDLLGNMTSADNGMGATLSYGYNVASQLTSMSGSSPFPAGLLSNLQYNPFGEPTSVPLGNTITENLSYDVRGRLQSRTDTTPNPVPGVAPTGSVTVNGNEQSVTIPATRGTGNVTISGTERSAKSCTETVPIRCTTVWDTGDVGITVNGFTKSVGYSGASTSSGIATLLANAFNGAGSSPVTASATGSVVYLTSKAVGAATNYSLSTATDDTSGLWPNSAFAAAPSGPTLTSGKDAVTIYDAGSIWVQVGSFQVGAPQTAYGQGSTTASLVSALVSGFGTSAAPVAGSPVNASSSGNTVYLTAKQTDAAYSLSGGQSTSQGAYFSQPSFNVSSSGTSLLNTVYSLGLAYTGNGDVQIGNDSVNGNWTYTYDDFNRLSTAVASNTGQGCSWDYDRFGNRLHQNTHNGSCFTFSYTSSGNDNRIDGYSYDAAGNLLNDGHHTFAYDAEDRITTLDGGGTARYVYDADGRRARKYVGTGRFGTGPPSGSNWWTIDYIYDLGGHEIGAVGNPSGPVTLLSGSSAGELYLSPIAVLSFSVGEQVVTSSFPSNAVTVINKSPSSLLISPSLPGSPTGTVTAVSRVEIYAADRHIATYSNAGTTSFIHADWLGTERLRTSISAALVETCNSFPFGDGLSCSGTDVSPMHLTGKERDAESNLDYFGARHYTSAMGRFMQPDPVIFTHDATDPQTWNKYTYAFNRPTVLVDPNGAWPGWYHHQIIQWNFSNLGAHAVQVLDDASDWVDSVLAGNQAPERSFMHAMRDGTNHNGHYQTVAEARALTENYISTELQQAVQAQLRFEQGGGKGYSDDALTHFGHALHTVTDATSPEHAGFQPWKGPSDVVGATSHYIAEDRSAKSSEPADMEARYEANVAAAQLWTQFQADLKKARGAENNAACAQDSGCGPSQPSTAPPGPGQQEH